jgi:hypothetical protein
VGRNEERQNQIPGSSRKVYCVAFDSSGQFQHLNSLHFLISGRRPTPIDVHHSAAYKCGLLGAKIERQIRDLIRPAQAADRLPLI